MSLKWKNYFYIYDKLFEKYINNKYGVEAGFITMNMPLLFDRLEAKGVKNPIICTSFNKINFRSEN